MDDGVHLPDGLKGGVALALALAHAGDVHKVHGGGGVLFGMVILRQPVQTGVRHLGLADVGLGVGVGIAAGLGLLAGERVEKRGLARVRQSCDT